jgi:hypothetical protein
MAPFEFKWEFACCKMRKRMMCRQDARIARFSIPK